MENKFFEKAIKVVKYFKDTGKGHLTTSNIPFRGDKIAIEGKGLFTNFSICDYLKLATDPRLIEESVKAVRNNGTYTAVSRTYLKLGIYKEAEEMVSEIFGKKVLLLPRTTLTHITVLPLIIGRKDAVILDHQVHTTVRVATDMLKGNGIHVETIRHNDLEALKEKYDKLKNDYKKVWYLTDGIYSMFGDALPAKPLLDLLKKLDKLHLYVDDAHGMSWYGKNGQGYAMTEMGYPDKMFLVTSLGKGFGAGGSAVILPNDEEYEKILILGVPLMFTSPVEPATLGAIIASSKIHLSKEIIDRQHDLNSLIKRFYSGAKQLDLPIVDFTPTPITMLATGIPDTTSYISDFLFDAKMHHTGALYPAVPYNNSGIRILITLYQTPQDIDKILDVLDNAFKNARENKGFSNADILKHFKIKKPSDL